MYNFVKRYCSLLNRQNSLAPDLRLRWTHSADADFLYKSMHDISVEVFNFKKTVVIFGRRRRPTCKYFYILSTFSSCLLMCFISDPKAVISTLLILFVYRSFVVPQMLVSVQITSLYVSLANLEYQHDIDYTI